MTESLSSDIRAMTENMRNRRQQWQHEREQRRVAMEEAERRRLETVTNTIDAEQS
jgi:hypothetical protein